MCDFTFYKKKDSVKSIYAFHAVFLSAFATPIRLNVFKLHPYQALAKDGFVFYGGEQGIRTLEQVIARYTISNRAPSASSDNSPNILLDVLYIIKIKIASKNILCYNIFIKNIGGTL